MDFYVEYVLVFVFIRRCGVSLVNLLRYGIKSKYRVSNVFFKFVTTSSGNGHFVKRVVKNVSIERNGFFS